MRVLFDQGTPAPLRFELPGHDVATAFEMGWARLSNGELLRIAAERFDVLLTTDQNLPHHQNLRDARIAIVILPTTGWSKIRRPADMVRRAVDAARIGRVSQVAFPL